MQLDIVSKSMLDLPTTLSLWTEFGKAKEGINLLRGKLLRYQCEGDLGPRSFKEATLRSLRKTTPL